jgi:hypothetical protein
VYLTARLRQKKRQEKAVGEKERVCSYFCQTVRERKREREREGLKEYLEKKML